MSDFPSDFQIYKLFASCCECTRAMELGMGRIKLKIDIMDKDKGVHVCVCMRVCAMSMCVVYMYLVCAVHESIHAYLNILQFGKIHC